jgi:TPR repeat protein
LSAVTAPSAVAAPASATKAVKLVHFSAAAEAPAPVATRIASTLAAPRIAESEPQPQTTRPLAADQQPNARPRADTTLALGAGDIAVLVKRGKDQLMDGDISSARLLLQRAAEAGNAEAALALGSTFDPLVIERLGAIGVQPDTAKARQWYQKAADLGSNLASGQLAKLAAADQ